jgi:ComF family protein
MITLWHDLVSLLFPDLCIICRKPLVQNENRICIGCLFELPGTNNEYSDFNPVMNQLQGMSAFENAIALYVYSKAGCLKQPIHALKYRDGQSIGVVFGELLGSALQNEPLFNEVTMIIPVPLHPLRYKKRGYNQSKLIADGVASKLKVPVREDILIRSKHSNSQTKKNMWEREIGASHQFEVVDQDISGHNILVIDDIITTGSTLISCSNAFIGIEKIRLFAAAIAFTKK